MAVWCLNGCVGGARAEEDEGIIGGSSVRGSSSLCSLQEPVGLGITMPGRFYLQETLKSRLIDGWKKAVRKVRLSKRHRRKLQQPLLLKMHLVGGLDRKLLGYLKEARPRRVGFTIGAGNLRPPPPAGAGQELPLGFPTEGGLNGGVPVHHQPPKFAPAPPPSGVCSFCPG